MLCLCYLSAVESCNREIANGIRELAIDTCHRRAEVLLHECCNLILNKRIRYRACQYAVIIFKLDPLTGSQCKIFCKGSIGAVVINYSDRLQFGLRLFHINTCWDDSCISPCKLHGADTLHIPAGADIQCTSYAAHGSILRGNPILIGTAHVGRYRCDSCYLDTMCQLSGIFHVHRYGCRYSAVESCYRIINSRIHGHITNRNLERVHVADH